MNTFIPCFICGCKAKWSYTPGKEYFCDEHVPRGCSCNHEYVREEYEHISTGAKEILETPPPSDDTPWKWIKKDEIWTYLDDMGREYPCIEFCYLDGHEDQNEIDMAWDDYYDAYPDRRPPTEAEQIQDEFDENYFKDKKN